MTVKMFAIPAPEIELMPKNLSIAPDQVRFFDLGLKIDGSSLEFKYGRAGIENVDGEDDARKWENLDKKIRNAITSGRFPNQGDAGWRRMTSTAGRPRFGISLEVPEKHEVTDQNGTVEKFPEAKKCFFVVKLDCSDLNWSFSGSFHPFATALQPGDRHKVLSNACHLEDSDPVRIYRKPKEQLAGTYGQPKWAGFLFDFAALKAQNIVSPYRVRFNIYAEAHDDQSGNRLPFIVDPDVGHPGGSYPPPNSGP